MTQVDITRDPASAQVMSATSRVGQLQQQGYGWLPIQTLYTLVDSGLSDSDVNYAVQKMTDAAKQSDQRNAINRQAKKAGIQTGQAANFSFKQFFDDPVLQKAPSAGLALKQYLSGAIGAWPVSDQNLAHVQQQLQVRGFGQDLPVDGVWNQAWDAAHNQYAEQLYQSHVSGEGVASASLKQVMTGLNALMPVNAFDAVIGFIKSIPSGVRDLMADFAGGAAGAIYNIGHDQRLPFFGGEASKGEYQAYGDTAAAVKNALGANTNSQSEADMLHKHALGVLTRDLSTIYLLSGVMGVGKRFAQAIGEESALAGTEAGAQLGIDAATRGPGVIARTLSTQAGTQAGAKISRAVVGGVLGGVGVAAAGSDDPLVIAGGIAGGGLLGYLTATNALRNIPILSNTGPIIDSLADADGLYYKTRALAATPYKYAPVRVAGETFQDLTLLGAKARGSAAIQDELGGTDQSKAITGEHLMNTVDDAIRHRLDFTVLGMHIAPSIDDLQFFLHGPTKSVISGTDIKVPEAKVSGIIGQQFNAILTAYHDALGDPGIAAATERITGKSVARQIIEAGGFKNWNDFWGHKYADRAAAWLADHERNMSRLEEGLPVHEPLSDPDRLSDLATRYTAIRSDPEKLAEAMRGYRAQGPKSGIEDFVGRVNWEKAVNGAGPKGSEYADIPTYMSAVEVARQRIHPRLGEIVGEGRTASDKALLHGVETPGNFGIARLDTFTQQDAHRAISDLEKEWADLEARARGATGEVGAVRVGGVPLEEYHAWNDKMDGLLKREFGIEPTEIPEQGAEKLQVAKDASKHLSVEILPHPDAPADLVAAFHDLHGLGYKPVSGTGIGHIITGPSPIDALEGPLTWQRKLAEHLGLNPNAYPNRTASQARKTGIINAVNDAVNRGDVALPPYWDANTVLAALETDGFIDTTPDRFKGAIQALFKVPDRLANANGIDKEQALQELNHALMPRDIPRDRFVKAFTDPRHFGENFPASAAAVNANMTDQQRVLQTIIGDAPPMSEASAQALYGAIVRGSSDVPGYILGAQKLEDLGRVMFGFAGKGTPYRAGLGALAGAGAAFTVTDDPGSIVAAGAAGATLAAMGGDKLGWAMANLPNKLIQLRNEFRFELDPWFSLRRIAKVNVKLGVEGIEPTLNPLKAMQETGTLNEDREVLARVQPQLSNAISDDADRYLQSQDVFGLYNHRNYEAYAAGKWSRQGLSDGEIRERLVKTFEYGTGEYAGRSALERSTNFFFFPFSFEKTLYRNVGGYLLDRPAQRMLLTRALASYDDFSQNHADNPLSMKFMEKHLPILQEAAGLNAFAHGLSLGQPGGINRPLLNLFLPQSWSSSSDNLAKLKQFIPAVKNFGRLYDELSQQSTILQNTGINMWRDLKGIPATYGNPAKSTLTKSEQLTEAFTMQREWYTNYQAVIDHNAKTQNQDAKIRFPLSAEWGKYAGEPITKANIRQIIQGYYPEYDPNGAVLHATKNNADFQKYLLDTKGSDLHDYVQGFADNAHRLASGMSSNRFSGQDVANYTAALRAQAIYIAEHDPKFYALYSKSFRKILGPLERVN